MAAARIHRSRLNPDNAPFLLAQLVQDRNQAGQRKAVSLVLFASMDAF